jgi:hypothetical protein
MGRGSKPSLDDRIEKIALDALAKAKEYQGFATIPDQLEAFRADPVWSLFGMDNEDFLKLRNIGNYYTSIFRKMGDMYELFVRVIVAESLGLREEDMPMAIEVMIEGEAQTRTLDARIDLAALRREVADRIRPVLKRIAPTYLGGKTAFEVRCCYMIGDSKRIQADEHAAGWLSSHGYLSVLMIFCTTSLPSPVKRLRRSWVVTQGQESYDLLREITGYDLQSQLQKLKPKLIAALADALKVFQLPKLE